MYVTFETIEYNYLVTVERPCMFLVNMEKNMVNLTNLIRLLLTPMKIKFLCLITATTGSKCLHRKVTFVMSSLQLLYIS